MLKQPLAFSISFYYSKTLHAELILVERRQIITIVKQHIIVTKFYSYSYMKDSI